MADPALIAEIITAAGKYSNWKSVEIERTVAPMSYMTFRAAEPGVSPGSTPSWGALQLMTGDAAAGYLAGQLAITGTVTVRQASYDADNHEVQIVVGSITQNGDNTTVDGKPGQYLKSNMQQIANAVMSPVNVNAIVDEVPGSDKPFARVSEHIGEGRLDFLRRLGMMRNLHMVDDEFGNLKLTRATTATGSIATLTEGLNILKARMVLNRVYSSSRFDIKGSQPGGSSTGVVSAPSLHPTASVQNPDWGGPNRPSTVIMDMPGDQDDAQMRANHELSLESQQSVEALITVPGWLAPNGLLWIAGTNLRKPVTINSPSLIPMNPFTLFLRGAKHIQDDERGSVTELNLCLAKGLMDPADIDIDNARIPER